MTQFVEGLADLLPGPLFRFAEVIGDILQRRAVVLLAVGAFGFAHRATPLIEPLTTPLIEPLFRALPACTNKPRTRAMC